MAILQSICSTMNMLPYKQESICFTCEPRNTERHMKPYAIFYGKNLSKLLVPYGTKV